MKTGDVYETRRGLVVIRGIESRPPHGVWARGVLARQEVLSRCEGTPTEEEITEMLAPYVRACKGELDVPLELEEIL